MPNDDAGRWKKVAESLWDVVTAADTTKDEQPTSPPAARCEAPVTPPNPEWRWLSPLEEQILAVVTDQHRTAPELATALKLTCSSDFRMVLRNLVARHILDSSGEGYRLRRESGGQQASPPGD